MNGGCSTTPFSCTFCRSRLIFINKVHGLVSQKKKKIEWQYFEEIFTNLILKFICMWLVLEFLVEQLTLLTLYF